MVELRDAVHKPEVVNVTCIWHVSSKCWKQWQRTEISPKSYETTGICPPCREVFDRQQKGK